MILSFLYPYFKEWMKQVKVIFNWVALKYFSMQSSIFKITVMFHILFFVLSVQYPLCISHFVYAVRLATC